MKTYAEKLQHPKWQKKRLRIMTRDNFTCQECGSQDNTLHVHHLIYFKGADPWDYNDDCLVTLCVVCHEKEHGLIPAQVAEVERKYEELKPCPNEPDVITSINQQINQLTAKLADNPHETLEVDILSNLMFLYGLKKKLTDGENKND